MIRKDGERACSDAAWLSGETSAYTSDCPVWRPWCHLIPASPGHRGHEPIVDVMHRQWRLTTATNLGTCRKPLVGCGLSACISMSPSLILCACGSFGLLPPPVCFVICFLCFLPLLPLSFCLLTHPFSVGAITRCHLSACLSIFCLYYLPTYTTHAYRALSFFLVFSILNIKNMLTYNLFLFRCVLSLAVFTLNAKPPHDHPPPSLPDRSAGPAACTPAAHASPTAPELTG